jgi:hypothetical protein
VGDIVMGPFYQDCTGTGCQACCNAGSRTLYLVDFPNGTLEYADDDKLEWQTCFPQPSDVKFPFKFGQTTSLSGRNSGTGTGVRDGILIAFTESNTAGSLNGRDAVLISYDDHSRPYNYTASNYEQLVTLDAVLALAGLTGYNPVSIISNMRGNGSQSGGDAIPIIGFTSGSPSLHAQFRRSVVSITPSSYEEMAGALDYYIGSQRFSRVAILYENSIDGHLTSEGLTKALRLRNLEPHARVREGSSISAAIGAQVLFVFNPLGDLVSEALSTLGPSVPVCVLSSQNPDGLVKRLVSNVSAVGLGLRQQSSTLGNLHFTQALPNPNPDLASPQVALPNVSSLLDDYRSAMTAFDVRNTEAVATSYASLNGYIIGRFLLAVISTINGRVTSNSILQSIYSSGVIDLSGYRLGLYYDKCNETGIPCCSTGTRSIYVVQPSIRSGASALIATEPVLWITRHAFSYTNCSISFDPESTTSTGGLSTAVGAVVGVVVGVGGFLLLALLVALVLAAILVRLSRRRQRDEWEISFDELELGSLLGVGGYGEVYKGRWRGTEVAIKTINTSREVTREMRTSFVGEARIMSRLRHPNVVLFMAACTKPPTMCIVMEFMGLGSLFDVRMPAFQTSSPLFPSARLTKRCVVHA